MMRKVGVFIAVLSAVSFMLPAQSFAQSGFRWKESGGWVAQAQSSQMYNSRTAETISGEVVSVNTTMPMRRMSHGVHLTVKTAKETISVHLGPSWYIENQDIQIKPGDKIQVKGSRTNLAGQPAIIAAEVKKDDAVLILRDNNGFPVWSGWRRRQ